MTTLALQSPAAARPDAPAGASVQDWIAVFAGALGALIASLDISITNSALPTIQGEIGASGTEGTWISTGYLVSEVVMIPLSAWLTRVLGMRTLLLTCVVMFTAFSMLCASAHDLSTMVVGRAGQGFFGGALIPTAQTIVRTRLPNHQIPVGMSLFGLIVLLGPLVGPLIGGWLTEHASWQWCFFINLPIAAALVALLLLGLPHVRSSLQELIHADWLGIAGMAVGLSSLTVVLEEGQRARWFESPMIIDLTIATVVGLSVMMIAQFTSRRPVIKLSLLLNRSYASVIILVVAVGMVFFSIVYVLPQFLVVVAGYNPEQSGQVLFISGVPAFMLLPMLPFVLGRLNIRLVVFCGIAALIISCFLDIHLSPQSSGDDFVTSQLLRGFGQVLCFMPLNQASVGAVSRADTADASGLYNMARNLGGSIGLALIGVFVDLRVESHADAIRQSLDANSLRLQDRLAEQAAAFAQAGGDLAQGRLRAVANLANVVHRQALVMTYSECFWVLGAGLILLSPLTLLLKAPAPGAAATESH
jgi:DHA2 family multidrug resistance protein